MAENLDSRPYGPGRSISTILQPNTGPRHVVGAGGALASAAHLATILAESPSRLPVRTQPGHSSPRAPKEPVGSLIVGMPHPQQSYGTVIHNGYIQDKSQHSDDSDQNPLPTPPNLPDPTDKRAVSDYFNQFITPIATLEATRSRSAPAHFQTRPQTSSTVQFQAPQLPYSANRIRGASTIWRLKAASRSPLTVAKSDAACKSTVLLPPYGNPICLQVDVPKKATSKSHRSAVSARAHKNTPNKRDYGEQVKEYPRAEAAPPFNVPISMREITSFFPNWITGIPEVAIRAQMNDWPRELVVQAEAYADGSLDSMDASLHKQACDRIQQQFSGGGKAMFDINGAWCQDIPEKCQYTGNKDLTANHWHFKSQWEGSSRKAQFEHISLESVRSRVTAWPSGVDRLMITHCLEFAAANPTLELDTSHWDWIMQMLALVDVVPGPPIDENHDEEAAKRFQNRH